MGVAQSYYSYALLLLHVTRYYTLAPSLSPLLAVPRMNYVCVCSSLALSLTSLMVCLLMRSCSS